MSSALGTTRPGGHWYYTVRQQLCILRSASSSQMLDGETSPDCPGPRKIPTRIRRKQLIASSRSIAQQSMAIDVSDEAPRVPAAPKSGLIVSVAMAVRQQHGHVSQPMLRTCVVCACSWTAMLVSSRSFLEPCMGYMWARYPQGQAHKSVIPTHNFHSR